MNFECLTFFHWENIDSIDKCNSCILLNLFLVVIGPIESNCFHSVSVFHHISVVDIFYIHFSAGAFEICIQFYDSISIKFIFNLKFKLWTGEKNSMKVISSIYRWNRLQHCAICLQNWLKWLACIHFLWVGVNLEQL